MLELPMRDELAEVTTPAGVGADPLEVIVWQPHSNGYEQHVVHYSSHPKASYSDE